MRLLIAMLIGAIVATASVGILVHNSTAVRPAPIRVLYNYGSG